MENIGINADGLTRVGQSTCLFAGKQDRERDIIKFSHVGTGSIAFANNEDTMTVTSGQYYIKQSKRVCPYFEGKVQSIELTSRNLHLQTGVIKQVGYFSCNGVAPYTANKDGYLIESNGDTNKFSLVSIFNGTETVRIESENFNGDFNLNNFNNLDLSKFQVFKIEFLWLGGAAFKLWGKIKNKWVLIHSEQWDGAETGDTFGGSPIVLSPNQFVRYEIRSTTGTGSLTYVCSQVATEGSIDDSGYAIAVRNTTAVTTNTIGTVYSLKGLKKRTGFKNTKIQILDFSVGITSTTDSGVILLLLNPTLSAPLTYANTSKFQEGTPSVPASPPTVTSVGRILKAIPINSQSAAVNFGNDYLNSLGINIDNSLDEIVLAYQPTSTNQSVSGTINLKEY